LFEAVNGNSWTLVDMSNTQRVFQIEKREGLEITADIPNVCHVYYIHRDGSIFREPDVAFDSGEDLEKYQPCGEDRLTLMSVFTSISSFFEISSATYSLVDI